MEKTWLDIVMEDLANIDTNDLYKPEDGEEKGDHFVGNLSDKEMRILTLSRNLQKKAEEAKEAAQMSDLAGDDEAQEKMKMEIRRICEKSNILNGIFWCSIKEKHNLWGKSIAIRKGGKIVWFEKSEHSGAVIIGFIHG